jgi:predicted thioesterase
MMHHRTATAVGELIKRDATMEKAGTRRVRFVLEAGSDLYEIYLDLAAEFLLPVRMFSRESTDV